MRVWAYLLSAIGAIVVILVVEPLLVLLTGTTYETRHPFVDDDPGVDVDEAQ